MNEIRATVVFATSNKGKLSSVRRVFGGRGIAVVRLAADIPEIQDNDVAAVAAAKCVKAAERCPPGSNVLVVDSALRIPALNGFPGPFVKQVTDWLGPDGYVSLLSGYLGSERTAVFTDAIACMAPGRGPRVFLREVYGTIADRVWDGTGGTGKSAMDRVFIPDGCDKALIAMSTDELAAFRSSGRIEYAYHEAARWFLVAL